MAASSVAMREPPCPTARDQTEHLLLSALLHWPYTPDTDSPSVLLLSPSGNGKSHLVQHVMRRARSRLASAATASASSADALSSSSSSQVALVTPSMANALASQQRDGSTSLRAVCRRAVMAAVAPAGAHATVHDAWTVLVHFDHMEHFLATDGDATALGAAGDADKDETDERNGAEGGFAAFSAYPTLMADLYALCHGCPPLFSREECQQLGLHRLVFVSSFSTERGECDLHPFARAKLFDVVCSLDTPNEAERRRFLDATVRGDGGSRSSAGLAALAQRTGGLTYAGLVEVSDLWWWQRRHKRTSELAQADAEVAQADAEAALAQRVVAEFRASGTVPALQCRRSAGYVDVQATYWTDIAGMDHVKAQLRQMVTRPLHAYAQYQQRGVRHSTGVLLHGPPGTGKTMLAKAMATELNASFIYVDLPELVQAEVGESERKLKGFFDVARQRSPSVIFMDELQAAFGLRYHDGRDGAASSPAGSSHDARLVSHLLQLLDAAQQDTEHLVIFVGATNVVHLLDPLLLRPGRLDTHLAVPLPDEAARASLARRVVCGEWGAWFVASAEDGTRTCLAHSARVQAALVTLFVAASPQMSGAELRNAMSVFALRLVQACLPTVTTATTRRAAAEAEERVGERLIAFLLRQGIEESEETAGDNGAEPIKAVLSDAALDLAKAAFAIGQS